MTDNDTARMLAEVQAANAELARRAVAPVWYHPALGLLAGGMIVVLAAPVAATLIYVLFFALSAGLLVAAYRRHTGLWINGYRKGRTRWVTIAMAATYAVIAVGCLWLARERGMTWAPYVGGALVAVVVTAAGFLWEVAFRRDLRDESGL